MQRLKASYEGYTVYNAGLPHFSRNFSRDSLIAGIFAGNVNLLRDQLTFCSIKQASEKNPHNGAEPGKIHHEYPSVKLRGLSTEFNACDTTALFLIGHEVYQRLSGDRVLARERRNNLEKAVEYILVHLKNGMFVEDPKFCDGKRFALKVTYWKDSTLIQRKNGKPVYPVIYPLVHIISMRGIRSAAKLLEDQHLKTVADEMAGTLTKMWDKDNNCFYIAIDQHGSISGVSSDALHSLYYLEPGDITFDQVQKIAEVSKVLETALGYRSIDPRLSLSVNDTYHTKTVWPFEQAVIHSGARKFNLARVSEVSARIMPWLQDSDTEIFYVNNNGTHRKGGCDPQLWTIAAKQYFASQSPFVLS